MTIFNLKERYESEVRLGERYKDIQTGITGTVVGLTFYQYGCERAIIEAVVAGKIEEYSFDTPRLENVETKVVPTTTKTGGPRDIPARVGLR